MNETIIDFFAVAGEETMQNVVVKLDSMDDDAQEACKRFFKDNPKAFNEEYKASKINPIQHPLAYFRVELKEKEHNNIRERVNRTGKMTLPLFREWQKQNESE